MDTYIIQVQAQDELTVIIDKIINTQADRVYLLIPEKSRIAEHLLNFRLLKREADTLGKEVIVVSESSRVQGLAVKSSLQAHQETQELKMEAQKASSSSILKTPKLADIVPSATKPKGKISAKKAEDTKSREPEKKIANFWNRRPISPKRPVIAIPKNLRSLPRPRIHLAIPSKHIARIALFSLIGISGIIAALTFYSVLPNAKVFITPMSEDVTLEMDISDTVASQLFEKRIESSRSAATTGEREIEEHASGVIRIYNSYSSSPQTLVKTTRFVSEAGILFRTAETIVVPGAEIVEGKIVPSSTTVNVIAAKPGEEYNIGPSTFSIPGFKGTPKYLAFYGKSESKIEGGKIGLESVVTRDDYNNLEGSLKTELTGKIDEALRILLPEGFVIPEGASRTYEPEIISSNSIDSASTEFTMTGSILIKAFAIREVDVINLMRNDFENEFPGKQIVINGGGVTYEILNIDFEQSKLALKASLQQRAIPSIDAQEIKEGLVGKREDVVRSYLASNPDIKEAKVTFWPFWVNKITDDLSRVEVIITPY